jgi:hypothetical protein
MALDEHGRRRTLLTDPRNPLGYLRSLLGGLDLVGPSPTKLARREHERVDAARLAEIARRRREATERAARAATPDSPARQAALAAIRQIGVHAKRRATARRFDATLADAADREAVAAQQRRPALRQEQAHAAR